MKFLKIFFKSPITAIKLLNKIFILGKDFFNYRLFLKKGSILTDTELNFGFLNIEKYYVNREYIIKNLKSHNKLLEFAKKFCTHKFDLLGSGEVKVYYGLEPKGFEEFLFRHEVSDKELEDLRSRIKKKIGLIFNNQTDEVIYNDLINYNYEPIDWHIDFKSGYRWDKNLWYKKIKYGNVLGADIKVPWELSRSYHLLNLAQAYYLTNDENFTKEFIYQIVDWMEENPVCRGVNWSCTMDVSIRVCNWILALVYFKKSKLINDNFLYELSKNIFTHGMFIYKNLEKGLFVLENNHYVSDIVGLIYIGLLFRNTRQGKKWLKFGIKELKRQIKKQIYDDGCDFEASTCYHRLVLELFLYAAIFVIQDEINKKEYQTSDFTKTGEEVLGQKYIEKLKKMFEATLYLLKPDGNMPQIGDNDNGRLHIFSYYPILEMKYLLTLGAVFFENSSLKIKEFGFYDDALWVFGLNAIEIWNNLKFNELTGIKSKAFESSGWYIIRNNYNYMIVSSGSNGQNGIGGHAHNDKLSFELFYNDTTILSDPGTYVYTVFPSMRNEFRSTKFHNTIAIDDQEQNRFNKKSLFFLENDSKIIINNWIIKDDYDFFDATYYGYKRLNDEVVHRRQIIYDKINAFWLIRDILLGKGNHRINLFFNLGKDLEYEFDGKTVIVTNDKLLKLFMIKNIGGDDLELTIDKGYFSSSYGNKENIYVLEYSKYAKLPTEFLFLLSSAEINIDENLIKKYLDIFMEKLV